MHHRSMSFIALFATVLLCGPSPLDAYGASADYTLTTVAYGTIGRQRLDVYAPNARAENTQRAVVVFFYGGGWEIGSRERYRFVGKALTEAGFVAVVPDYRVYPEAVFPDFIRDCAKAVAWTKKHIDRFGGDPARIFVMGHSAGAHIAAMIALDPQYLRNEGLTRAELRGVIGLAGPYDFLPIAPGKLEFIFGSEAERWRSQPINFADGANPPMLLLTGDRDSVVPPGNTRRLAAKIRA